jgi:DNA-directed RNA polymerase I subunit RPA1
MTLNTFHFAGHGAANVTLGIPRLREIVMTASQNIKTPTMQLPILASVSDDRVKSFCQSTTRLTLSQIVDEVTVKERLSPKSSANGFSRQKLYTVRLAFYPHADYVLEHSIEKEQILAGIQRTFVPRLDREILKEIKKKAKEMSQVGDMGKGRRAAGESSGGKEKAPSGDDDEPAEDAVAVGRDSGEQDDGDADDARRGRQGADEITYDSDEAEDLGDEEGLEAAFKDSDDEGAVEDEDSEDEEDVIKRTAAESLTRMKEMQRKIASTSKHVDKVRFDVDAGEWCEFDLEVSPRLRISESLF